MREELYEDLGLFYLGKRLDLQQEPTGLLELIKNNSLTTHAAIIGMTGSGKSGLGTILLEEAAIDNIPAIIIDPKGDMGNLLLAFDDLSPESFKEWIDPLQLQDRSLDQYAEEIAALWREGIEEYGQSPERIRRYRESVERTIYTPGSKAGVPINLLASFKPPSNKLDMDSYTELLKSTASSLLRLIGEKEQRSFILITNILDQFWRETRELSIEELIAAIVNPPFKKIGIFPLDQFYPSQERMELALKFNMVISNPTLSQWLEGEPLSIPHLLYTEEGRPRHSIFYLAHLNGEERLFFVTKLLTELISWMRTQSGTSTLRALLYIDEIFGYLPPSHQKSPHKGAPPPSPETGEGLRHRGHSRHPEPGRYRLQRALQYGDLVSRQTPDKTGCREGHRWIGQGRCPNGQRGSPETLDRVGEEGLPPQLHLQGGAPTLQE
ncbi:MAG: ATP-binding protein [Epsilonproteobacteria bacterium]|nr:hypothetical protein [Campylobacterota bacterium]NPA57403.1 ATP-binding protein [Campylobacterota bacterium]